MPSQTEIQENITNRIIDGLQNGIVPWKKPWRNDPNCGAPTNVVSGRNYSGINPLLLNLASQAYGFTSRFWGTYPQWQKLGGQVKKRPDNVEAGRWGSSIVFYKQIKKTKVDETGTEKTESFPLMKFFTVFNLDQVEGAALDHLRPSTTEQPTTFADFAEAEKVIAATSAEIKYGGNKAVYTRPVGMYPNHVGGDFIRMPERRQFESQHEFYATLMHECVHWSEIRLGWEGSYAMGELIAEMGAAFLCANTNIPSSDDLSNHTAYLASWLKALKDDRKFIFKAAAQASKATEFILKFSCTKEEVPELEEVEA